MADEFTGSNTNDSDEVQGNDSEVKTDIQEETNGDTGREEIEIKEEIKEEQDNSNQLEQLKETLMSYVDKIVTDKLANYSEVKEVEEEQEEQEEKIPTLFNNFKD